MTNVTEINQPCSICGERKLLSEFASYRDEHGQPVVGLICKACSMPSTAAERQPIIQQISQELQKRQVENFNVQEDIAKAQRQFGPVDSPQPPPELSATTPQASAGNEAGFGRGGSGGAGPAHPLLKSQQFAGEDRRQTADASNSRQQQELQHRKELTNTPSLTHQAMSRPSGPAGR